MSKYKRTVAIWVKLKAEQMVLDLELEIMYNAFGFDDGKSRTEVRLDTLNARLKVVKASLDKQRKLMLGFN